MYKRIVVGTDGSAGANIAIDAAIELSRLTGATLHVVQAHKVLGSFHVAAAAGAEVGIAPVEIAASNEEIHAQSQRICDAVAERAKSAGVPSETHCVSDDPADALIKVAEDTQADLIVVGNRGMTGARRFVLGSVPNKVSHHCPASLLIVDTSHARD
jgi:nucleotide-binding universal stress UspA family protein